MSFDKPTRNALSNMVGNCRRLLADDIRDQLQGVYGLQPDGTALPVSRLTYLDELGQGAARSLRDWQEHLAATEAGSIEEKKKAAFDRLAYETAFTVLNRLAALRMCEERGHVIECVRRGMESDGFVLYERLSGGALGTRGETYRIFLERMFDELAVDLGALFDLRAPQSLVFPRERCLEQVLAELNRPDLAHLWKEDETIGWVYQYFNSEEERKKMRKLSSAPRNSRELAVRNQFFTPRYVVEFLVDNTLGRIWYEMRRGRTSLADNCRYLVRRKRPVFLEPNQEAPEPFSRRAEYVESDEMWTRPNPDEKDLNAIFQYALTVNGYEYSEGKLGRECGDLGNERLGEFHQTKKWRGSFEELRCCLFFEQRRYHHFGWHPQGEDAAAIQELYKAICERWDFETEFIAHRSKKDPRDLKILDPACGSAHFLLYCFDLLETIYDEAWADDAPVPSEVTGKSLREDFADLDILKEHLPELILRYNLHGIDIDLRACQIAALALWLRAQRSYQRLGLKVADRPKVKKTNIVCAEPMPGEKALLDQFVAGLEPNVIGQLVQVVFEKMKLAGEAGSLLKIEEEIASTVGEAKKQWLAGPKAEQGRLFADDKRPEQQKLSFDFSGITDAAFWEKAEERIYVALKAYAEHAENGASYRRHLFADDAARGFAFIDICRKRYDVVLMNPPFGQATGASAALVRASFQKAFFDLFASFLERGIEILTPVGALGAITTSAGFYRNQVEEWRASFFLDGSIRACADLGGHVLDGATVRTATYVRDALPNPGSSVFIRCNESERKTDFLCDSIHRFAEGNPLFRTYVIDTRELSRLPGRPLAYWLPLKFRRQIANMHCFSEVGGDAQFGLSTKDDFRFLRLAWEVPPHLLGEKNR